MNWDLSINKRYSDSGTLLNFTIVKQVSILFFVIGLLTIQSCCKCDDPTNRDCPNYDPCFEIEEPIVQKLCS